MQDLFNIDRDALLKVKPLVKRLSCNFLKYDFEGERYYIYVHKFIFRQFYDLFRFITGEREPVVEIKPDTNASHCSMLKNDIQLGTKMLYDNRFSQQFKVDVMFAIMLHEMFHKTITNNSLAKYFLIEGKYYDNKELEKEVNNKIKDNLYMSVMNILEDRRIERLGLNMFPGYVFYFDEKRKHAMAIHSDLIKDITILGDEISLIRNYILYKILLPEILNPYLKAFDYYYARKSATTYGRTKVEKIIKKIDQYIDSNESVVYSDDIKDIFEATEMILLCIPLQMKKDMMKQEGYSNVNQPMGFDSKEETDDCHSESCKKIVDIIKQEQKEQEEEYLDTGGCESTFKIEDFDPGNDSTGTYNKVITTTMNFKSVDNKILTLAKPISNQIKTNLAFLASKMNMSNDIYEQTEGDIDEDELYSIKYSKDLFYTEQEKPGFELDFGILLDESGSMSVGNKLLEAKTTVLACILAMEKEDFINLFVYGHSNMRLKKTMGVELYEYYNKKRKVSNWKNIFAARAAGGNADGYAILKVAEIMMKDSKNRNKILVVVSDGLPSANNYGGPQAEAHVKSIVNSLEKKGFEIIQICIDNIDRSKYMFNNYIPYNNNFVRDFNKFLRSKIAEISSSF